MMDKYRNIQITLSISFRILFIRRRYSMAGWFTRHINRLAAFLIIVIAVQGSGFSLIPANAEEDPLVGNPENAAEPAAGPAGEEIYGALDYAAGTVNLKVSPGQTQVSGILPGAEAVTGAAETVTFSVYEQGSKGVLAIENTTTGAFTYTPNTGAEGEDTAIYSVTGSGGYEAFGIVNIIIYPRIVYRFQALGFPGKEPGQDGWGLWGTDTFDTPAPVISWEGGSVKIGSTGPGHARSFSFDVPSDGYYRIGFKADLCPSAANPPIANVAVFIDDVEAGKYISVDNSQTTRVRGPERLLSDTARSLAAGTHKLTLKSADTGGRMWVEAFILEKVAGVIADTIEFRTSKGADGTGFLSGADENGGPLTFSVAEQGKKGVLTIDDPATGKFTYTPNIGETGADLVKYKAVNLSGDEAEGIVNIEISSSIIYTFNRLGFTAEGSPPKQSGWDLEGAFSDAPAVGLESDGNIMIDTTKLGQSRSFTFNIPENGLYKVSFKAPLKAPSSNPLAANIAVIIDGEEIGKYTCVNPTAGEGPVRDIGSKPKNLAAGTHTLTLKSADTNGKMWATEFILDKTPVISAGIVDLTIIEGETGAGTLIGVEENNEELTFSVTEQGSKGTLTIIDEHAGTFSYTPAAGQTGADTVKYKVENISGDEAEGVVNIYICERLDPEHPVYDFFNLPGLQTEFGVDYGAYPQEGLKLVGDLLDSPRIAWEGDPKVKGDDDTVKIGSGIGNYRSFEFFIPQTGIYLMKFTGLKQSWGANIALSVDGKYMGKYMGYSETRVPNSTQEIIYTQLSGGWHVLKVLASDLSDGAINGRMYINSLSLDKLSAAPSIDHLSLVADQQDITEGMNVQVSVLAEINNPDGSKTPVDLQGMDGVEITYSADNPEVAVIDGATGRLKTIREGTVNVNAQVVYGGDSKSAQLEINVTKLETAKTRSTIYTSEEVANARRNAQQYDWAANMKDAAVAKADDYIDLGFDFLWNLIPPQSLPRCIFVNNELGSPTSGRDIYKYGNYPWIVDPINHPWKVEDPVTHELFPSNDFEAYYKSGLDEHGIFDPSLADRSLLVNELYPEKGPGWGVDDGMGWVDEDNNRFTFISYYVCMGIWWGYLPPLMESLREAYLYTGDAKYANAGVVLLDRIADMYPSLNTEAYSRIYATNHPGTNCGKAVGSIWDTTLVKNFLYAYDAFFPAMADGSDTIDDALAFLSQKAGQYNTVLNKATPAAIRKNIEDGIVKEVYPAVTKSELYGNMGMYQSALALAAVVYDKNPETSQWLDFDFQSGGLFTDPYRVTGGNVGAIFVNDVDRDGQGFESSLFYNSTWLSSFQEMASVLDGYMGYVGDTNVDLYTNVKFRKMFAAYIPLVMSERYTPSIGDTGACGNPSIILDQTQMMDAFQHYNEPIFAQAAYFLNNNKAEGLHGSIFAEDPEQIARQIDEIIQEYGTFHLDSYNMTGYGFAALRDGESNSDSYGITTFFRDLPVVEQTAALTQTANGLEFDARAAGDRVAFEFNVTAEDYYEIDVKALCKQGYGIYEVQIDGQTINETKDFFTGPFEPTYVGELRLTAGKHTLTFICKGRNKKATGYKMCLNELSLLNASEQARRDEGKDANTMRDVWMHYGMTTAFHAHSAVLNLGLHAFGLDLAPDLGYPETNSPTDAHHFQWLWNTISHNTVLVDQTRQSPILGGTPQHFDDSQMVKLMDVDATDAYPQTDMYRRTTAMVKVDNKNSYIVDFFRIEGGNEHHYSFHSAEGSVTAEGLNLVQQEEGTYAGADIPYGAPRDQDYRTYTGPGFNFLRDVERDTAAKTKFSVDWDIIDTWQVLSSPKDVHLKLTMLGAVDDVALANGSPAGTNAGNPEKLRYLIAHRSGTDLSTNFTSVIQPYEGQQFIKDSTMVNVSLENGTPVDELTAKAIKVELNNGRIDYIVSSINTDTTYRIDDKFLFKGAFGVYSEYEGQQLFGYVNDGTTLGDENSSMVEDSTASITGTVKDFTRAMQVQNSLTVEADVNGMDPQELIGRSIYVNNDGVRNAVYEIKGVYELQNGRIQLDIGDITLIRGYADVNDFSKGYLYDVAVDDTFSIPLSAEGRGATDPGTGESPADTPESGDSGRNDELAAKTRTFRDGKVTLELKLNARNILNFLEDGSHDKVISLPVTEESDKVRVELDGQLAAAMKGSGAILDIQTPIGSLRLPADQLGSGQWAGYFGQQADLSDLTVTVEISRTPEEQVRVIENEAEESGYTLVVPPVDFRIIVSDGKLTKEIDVFNTFVEREIPIPAGIDPSEISTAVVFSGDGTARHVPTAIIQRDGKYYARIMSLTNSTYGLIKSPKAFSDMEGHWAKDLVNEMASRRILFGTGDDKYQPDIAITRADFVTLAVRSLGLPEDGKTDAFRDVEEDAGYYGAVAKAYEYGLTEGDGQGNFNPRKQITREEAVTVLSRMLKIAGKEVPEGEEGTDSALEKFADRDAISGWAAAGIAKAAQLGIVEGDAGKFRPKDGITRAETAKIFWKLLNVCGLIES